MTFKITEEQLQKITQFRKYHKICSTLTGAIGGGNAFIFRPTGLGMVVEYQCSCGEVLDLTESDKW